jgi:hypothetical protein
MAFIARSASSQSGVVWRGDRSRESAPAAAPPPWDVWSATNRSGRFRLSRNDKNDVSQDLREQLQSTLGDAYLLERELGGGGMSRVFVAHEASLGRKVVVKVLLPELAAGVSVDRFHREIQLAAQLQHPHIVPLLAAGESNGLPYFTMPFVVGESLRARVARGELPVGEAVHILRDVVSALVYAHEFGVVHRDIKPDNVLLSGGVAVVTDFGVAKAVSVSAEAQQHTSLTSMGVALGTPAYMAPEQATADPNVDHRVDIYALGVVAYELLTGRTPFFGRSAQATLAAHVVEDPDPIERRRPGLPPVLAAMVMQCLAKRPADRPQSAAELMQTLDSLATPSVGMSPTQAVRAAPAATAGVPALGGRSAIRGVLAGGAVLALLIVAGTYWSRRPGAAPPAAPASGQPGGSPPAVPPVPDSVSPPAGQPADQPVRPPAGVAVRDSAAPPRGAAPARHRAPQIARIPFTPPAARDTTAATRPETTSVTTPPAVTAPVAAPAPDPRPDIRAAFADYAAAIESQNVGSLRRVYPAMSAAQQQGWEQFFGSVRDVKAALSLSQLDVQGSGAEAQAVGSYTYLNTSSHRTEQRPVLFHVTFRRDTGGWRITQVR